MPTPVVDADLCTGCELCIDIAPNTFEMDDEGVSTVVDSQAENEDAVQEAIDSCPTEAIAWAE